ncbi:MAG: hypothetical protein VKL42_12565 [Snowella sp.]|nr:hypothetical protein [Snowella sp.]
MSILDDLLLKLDSATNLYEVLKTADDSFFAQIRAQVEQGVSDDFGPDDVVFWTTLFANPRSWNPAILIPRILAKQNSFADAWMPDANALISAYKEGQKNNTQPPLKHEKPYDGNGTIRVKEDPIRVKVNPAPTIPTRKLKDSGSSVYQPGYSDTKVVPPISATGQLNQRVWGELICYAVQETAVVPHIPETAFEQAALDERGSSAEAGLLAAMAIDSLPGLSSGQREKLKQQLSYWANSFIVGPQFLRGLDGDMQVFAGPDFILNMARALSLRSRNAGVGFEPSLYLNVNELPVAGTISLTRSYPQLPFIPQRSLKPEVASVADKDLGYFMGIPYDERAKGQPKRANLQILFYAKEKPPYGTGSSRVRPSECNIPDPIQFTWESLKAACIPYQGGPVQTAVGLDNGRKMSVWAKDKDEGKDFLNRMIAFSSAKKATSFTHVEIDQADRPVKTMYPGSATLSVPATEENPGKARFLLYVDTIETANFRLYGGSTTP